MRVKCFRSNCQGERASGANYRGLCLKCYGATKKAVKSGKWTWDDVVRAGMCEPDGESVEDELERKLTEGGLTNSG